MKILYYDCFSGISGDMNLAAMIALGVDADYLRTELERLELDNEFSVSVCADQRKGIHGIRVDVVLHPHHPPAGTGHHAHEHRTLTDIQTIINRSGLDDRVKATSLSMFRRVAEAEATIHGTTPDAIHFHEVGATDAIVDIVGAAICFHALNVDAVWASPIELGGGFVTCAHGMMPVPAPATLEILSGIPTTRGAVQAEMTTPTGAAILAELASRFGRPPEMTVEKTAYGIGHRDTEIPNVLRVSIATVNAAPEPLNTTAARLLQCNIDDMTAEMLGVALEVLMDAGAMDVHFTPIVMKKNRPATCVSLLCSCEDERRFKQLLFTHTTTLGIKSFPLEKTVLDIAFETLDTPLGPITLKNAIKDGRIIRAKPELEDCRRIARENGLSLTDVYRMIEKHRKDEDGS